MEIIEILRRIENKLRTSLKVYTIEEAKKELGI